MSFSSPRRGRLRRGFTLIELLIVIAIIGALTSLVIPAVMKAREAESKAACINNLRQLGTACWAHHQQLGYFPTAGTADWCAPYYQTAGSASAPASGWKQDGGWAFQLLPYLDEDNIWNGGATGAGAATTNMTNSLKNPFKVFICPSRRNLAAIPGGYKNANFPSQALYSAVQNTKFDVVPIDYAGCNGNAAPTAALPTPGNLGIILSQASGRSTVRSQDVTDGMSRTLMLAEKAANPRISATTTILNEDDMGYAAAFGNYPAVGGVITPAANFNTIRFTASTLLPLKDSEVLGPTGGAFGSAHPGTWNAAMADGSVQSMSYTIDSTIYAAIGTRSGGEIVNDLDLAP